MADNLIDERHCDAGVMRQRFTFGNWMFRSACLGRENLGELQAATRTMASYRAL